MGETVTRVIHLKESMIGTETRPNLKLKAAKTKHFLPFVVELVRRHADCLHADVDLDALIATGQTLLDYTDVLAQEPRRVSEEAQKVCLQLCKRHLGALPKGRDPHEAEASSVGARHRGHGIEGKSRRLRDVLR